MKIYIFKYADYRSGNLMAEDIHMFGLKCPFQNICSYFQLRVCLLLCFCPHWTPAFLPSEDSCPEGSIDLKCKERVTDSDEDEPDGQVAGTNHNSQPDEEVVLTDIVCLFYCSSLFQKIMTSRNSFIFILCFLIRLPYEHGNKTFVVF